MASVPGAFQKIPHAHSKSLNIFDQTEEKPVEWARNPELMREIKSRRQQVELRRREKVNGR